ncbi:hypothetical protein D3C84_916110 [compost metagenome]
MHFINDIHFTADFGRRIFHLVPEITYLFNAPVRRCINFLHIHDIPRGDPQTGWAFIAWLSAFISLAIDSFGEHFGGTCLACTPRSTEQIGMRNPLFTNCILQRLNNVLLSYHVMKRLRPPGTIQRDMFHYALPSLKLPLSAICR